jgi:4'-phosphopantetheinyl transferase EntD
LLVRAAAVSDRTDLLYPEERDAVSRAADKRRDEYSSGRWLARELMAELDVPASPIPRGEHREPLWPAGVAGTITHAGEVVAASVARREHIRSVGLDLEVWTRMEEKLHRRVFTDRERTRFESLPREAPGLLFSAKEAGYKATFPLAGRFISFQDAETEVDWDTGEFRFRYVGDHRPSAVMEAGSGRFLICGRFVLCLFIIP